MLTNVSPKRSRPTRLAMLDLSYRLTTRSKPITDSWNPDCDRCAGSNNFAAHE